MSTPNDPFGNAIEAIEAARNAAHDVNGYLLDVHNRVDALRDHYDQHVECLREQKELQQRDLDAAYREIDRLKKLIAEYSTEALTTLEAMA